MVCSWGHAYLAGAMEACASRRMGLGQPANIGKCIPRPRAKGRWKATVGGPPTIRCGTREKRLVGSWLAADGMDIGHATPDGIGGCTVTEYGSRLVERAGLHLGQ